jgi:hypothetical protein
MKAANIANVNLVVPKSFSQSGVLKRHIPHVVAGPDGRGVKAGLPVETKRKRGPKKRKAHEGVGPPRKGNRKRTDTVDSQE